MAIKNIWSLTIDEALVIDKIKQEFKKEYEVFIPSDAHLKDVDLLLYNFKKNITNFIQVKGSRTYDPRKSETTKYGTGSGAWITISKKSIYKPTNKLDYFIFVLHSFADGKHKKEIKIDFLVLPVNEFRKIVSKKIIRKGNKYHFFIWIDSTGKRAFDFNDSTNLIYLSKYVNNWKILEK